LKRREGVEGVERGGREGGRKEGKKGRRGNCCRVRGRRGSTSERGLCELRECGSLRRRRGGGWSKEGKGAFRGKGKS